MKKVSKPKKTGFLFTCLLAFASCNTKTCPCKINELISRINDSIVNAHKESVINYLKEFDQRDLSKNENESYRLAIKASITNFAKIYLLEKKGNSYFITVNEYSVYKDGKYQNKLYKTHTDELNEATWDRFITAFDQNCLWTIEPDIATDNYYLDGNVYILEANLVENRCTKTSYHLAHRVNPGHSPFLNICEVFFKYEPLNMRNIYPWETSNTINRK